MEKESDKELAELVSKVQKVERDIEETKQIGFGYFWPSMSYQDREFHRMAVTLFNSPLSRDILDAEAKRDKKVADLTIEKLTLEVAIEKRLGVMGREERETVEPEEKAENRLVRSGDFWDLRFRGGKEFHVKSLKGMEYIATLLLRPDHEVPCTAFFAGTRQNFEDAVAERGGEEEACLDREDGGRGAQGGPGGYVLKNTRMETATEEGLEKLERAKENLSQLISAAKKSNWSYVRPFGKKMSIPEAENALKLLDTQIENTKYELEHGYTTEEQTKKIANAVANAVNDCIMRITRVNKDCGDHLGKTIQCGLNLAYRPGADTRWEVTT